MKRNADLDLSEVHHATKAERWLLIVVVPPHAAVSLVDHGLNLIQVSVKEIYFTRWCIDPRTSVHPRSPLIEARHNRYRFRYRNLFGRRPDVTNGERRRLAIVQANVEIGVRLGQTTRVRTTEDDRDYVRHIAESINDMAEQAHLVGRHVQRRKHLQIISAICPARARTSVQYRLEEKNEGLSEIVFVWHS